jgi:hypothetical protein
MSFSSSENTGFPIELEKLSISSGITKVLEALRIFSGDTNVLTENEKITIFTGIMKLC